jgi:WD40 repeat protein
LASASAANVDSRLDLALLLAVEAYRMHADHLTWAALFNAAMANPALERFLPADAAVTQVAASAGGAVIAAGTAAGTVSVWRAGTDRTDLARLSGPIRGLSMNDDGRVLAATTETDILVWQEDSEELIRTAPNGHRAYGIAVSPSGRTVVWITVVKDSGSPAELTVLDTTTGAMPTTRVGGTYVYTAVALPSDDEVVLLDEAYGAWQRRRLPDLAPIAAGYEGFGLHNKTSALSPDGSMLTYTNGDDVIPVASTLDDTVELSVASVGPSPSALAISRDLSRVATATAGTIYVADVTDGDRPEPPVSLAGVASVGRGALAFVDDRTRLVGGSADYVVQWNIANLGRIVRGIPGTALNACEACTGPRLTLSPDGRYALLISIGGREMVLRDLETGTEVVWEPGILFYRIRSRPGFPDNRTPS